MRRVLVVLVIGAGAVFACSDPTGSSPEEGAPSATEPAPDGATGNGRARPPADDATAPPMDASMPMGPSCDEDNPIKGTTEGSIDRPLPDAIVQFERSLMWGCMHREYHETRQWDYISTIAAYADRFAYVKKMGWTRAAIQEGAPGSGFDFLAMHRAMLGTLRDRFPEHAALFAGWPTIPTQPTADDPLPPGVDGGAPPPFWSSMVGAISRCETDLGTFATEDDLGRYIETQHRPTDTDPLARSTEPGAGLHTYVHVRFDDARSPIRMQRFSRNIENQTFFRLHGWIDRVWTNWRKMHGLDDAKDAAYLEMMNHACMHMGLMNWSVSRGACT